MFRKIILLALMIGLIGCSRAPGDSQEPTKPNAQEAAGERGQAVRILPENPNGDSTLEAEAPAWGNKSQELNYQWFRNGTPIPEAIGSTLPGRYLHKGDFISVQVRGPGGGDQRESDLVVIGNTPPVIKRVSLTPGSPTSSESIEAVVLTKDRDDDEVSISFEWSVNGQVAIDQDGPALPGRYVRRGDQVRVAVTPYDGSDYGKGVLSPEVVILNGAPTILSEPPERPEGDRYDYAVQAEDPDGDLLVFSLGGEPPVGMVIDGESGEITWQVVVRHQETTYVFEVIVEDPEGAQCIQHITMTSTPPTEDTPES